MFSCLKNSQVNRRDINSYKLIWVRKYIEWTGEYYISIEFNNYKFI